MYYATDTCPWACGLGVIGEFSIKNDDRFWGDECELKKNKFEGGGGGTPFFVAGFINEPECEKTYKLLEHHAVLAFQSPVMTNKNSGNKFFFCVFSTEPEHEKEKFSWPFKE